ncbi:MAG: DUF3667 domain-containing protein [Acidobacteriota bacterium]
MSTPDKPPETTEAANGAEKCPNCGAEVIGEYCAACGQKKFDPRDLSVKRFVGHLFDELTDLQSNKIVRSFLGLLFRPGLLTSAYLAGRKKRYLTPVRLYLTFSAIYFLFAWGTLSDVRGGGAERMSRSSVVVAIARRKGVDPHIMADRIQQRAEKAAAVLRFGSVLVSGLFLSLLYIRGKKYYVEHLIFSFHYYSFDFCCKSIFALLYVTVAAVGWRLPAMVLNFFYPIALIYLVFALRRVYRQKWSWTLLKSAVLFACETALFFAVNIAGFIIAFVMT